MDILKVDNQFKFLKDNFKNGNETKIFEYFEKYWIKKKNIFNYSDIIKNLINCKNLYIKKEGNRESENILFSKLKSLNLLFFQIIYVKIFIKRLEFLFQNQK